MRWLADLDALKRVSSIVQWCAIVLVFLGGLFQLSKYLIDRRITDLKEQLSNQKGKHYQETVTSLQATIHSQQGKLQKVEGELQQAKSKINTFSLRLAIRFSGIWSSKPYPKFIVSPVNHQYYVEITGDNTDKAVKFYATNTYVFTTLDERTALFESVQAVRDGDFPLGKGIDVLENFSKIIFHIPFIQYAEILD